MLVEGLNETQKEVELMFLLNKFSGLVESRRKKTEKLLRLVKYHKGV